MTRTKLVVALGALLACSGCFEEKVGVSLHADRSGKLHLVRRSGEALTLIQLLDASTPEEQRSCARKALVDELASWDGIAAWSDARYEVRDGRVETEATGWFVDANRVRSSEPGLGEHRLRVKTTASSLELAWTFALPESTREATLDHARVMVKALEGFELAGEIALPGPVTHAEGATGEGPAWTIFSTRHVEGEIRDLEKRIAAGELTAEEAARKLHANHDEVTARVRCEVTETKSAAERFRVVLDEAKNAWESSELRADVEARRSERVSREIAAASRR
ncbi:MAG TPA: hypothetical protein VFF73_15355 [Planctomycetota bacterium]|nr:hypothetical protein [Planctomycetota bacterium]